MIPGSIPAEWLPRYTYNDYKEWGGDWELICGFPYALSHSAKRKHQVAGRRFMRIAEDALQEAGTIGNCNVFYDLDRIVSENTVVRPDVMIVCGDFRSDYLTFPPVLVLEIASEKTRLKDRNVKFDLYQSNGVKYYILADPDKDSIEIFMLKNNRYEETTGDTFQLSDTCTIKLDLSGLWG